MQKSRGVANSCLEEKKKKRAPPPLPPPAASAAAGQLKKNTSESTSHKLPTTIEKKRTARVSELESQVASLQEDLKKVKDQLRSSELGRRQEAEEAKRRISFMAEKLEESKQQLMDLSNSEDDRVQQLRKLSQERDKAWQSELEAVQSQKEMDSAALSSAMTEIKKLRVQLGREDMQSEQLSETLNLVETLRSELADCRESEALAMEVVRNTERQLEIANVTADTLRSELERVRDQMKESVCRDDDDELNCVKAEASRLRCALEVAETRYQEEYIQSTLQIRSAYDQMEQAKQQSCQGQTVAEEKLKAALSRIEQLMSKDTDLSELKQNLKDKEMKLQMLSEENEAIRQEIISKRKDIEMESELRRLKVQSEQWRKAAEVATSMLPNTTTTASSSPNDSMEDDSPKKKNMMLRKIGVLWKKGQNNK